MPRCHGFGYAAVAVMLCVAAFGFSVHTLRRRYKAVDRWYMQQFGPILRPHERHALPGTLVLLMLAGTSTHRTMCILCVTSAQARSGFCWAALL